MATIEYGKELKMIRIKEDELSQTMAQKLNVSPSLLSAVESGARKIPVGFTERVSQVYNLTPDEIKRLKEAEEKAERNAVQITLRDLAGGDTAKHAILQFADKIKQLPEEDCKRILDVLGVQLKDSGEGSIK